MERFDTRAVCFQFCPCFSSRFLAFPVSSSFSKFCCPNAKHFHSMHIDELYSMCTVNLILLCHIRPTAHVHILCVWCSFKTICSFTQYFVAYPHVFLHGQFLIAVCLPSSDSMILWFSYLLSTGGQFSIKQFPFWTPMEEGVWHAEFMWQPNCKRGMAGL